MNFHAFTLASLTLRFIQLTPREDAYWQCHAEKHF